MCWILKIMTSFACSVFGHFDGCTQQQQQQQQTNVIQRRLDVGDIETDRRFVAAFILHPIGIDASNEWKFLHSTNKKVSNMQLVCCLGVRWRYQRYQNANYVANQAMVQHSLLFVCFRVENYVVVCHWSLWSNNSIRHQSVYYQSTPTALAIIETQQRMTQYFSDNGQLPHRLSTRMASAQITTFPLLTFDAELCK